MKDEELNNAASPYAKLEKTIAEQNSKLDDICKELKAQTISLDRLCTLKEENNISINGNWLEWRRGKRNGLIISFVSVALISTALYFDILKADPAVIGPILRIMGLVL